ncbi:TrmH family RNA methyltransferase (plasmid) [Catenovulum sp. SX2]|uniref:TrmH family RNA methyltransferase n=1 Tax=Catenovulum sp. SX2 TaxID=3398614 RepID=UPI003F82BC6F
MVCNFVLLNPRNRENLATVMRSGQNFSVSSVIVIGGFIADKYKGNIHKFTHQMDTQDGMSNLTVLYFATLEDFLKHLPAKTTLVVVEMEEQAKYLESYQHPENATYIFGPELKGFSQNELNSIKQHFAELNKDIPAEHLAGNKHTAHLDFVKIAMGNSLNVGVCSSIVMYDRHVKSFKHDRL